MRNPLKLPTFRRNPDRPTLKARAAILKAGLSRLIQRPAQHGQADQGRRAVMAGTVAAAIPLPALALGHPAAPPIAAVSADPHPDRALLDAEAALLRALETEAKAKQASEAAADVVDAVLKRRPVALVPLWWEWDLFTSWRCRTLWSQYVRFRHIPGTDLPEDHQRWHNAWTGDALRLAISQAVPALGRGGRTPHYIRRWRALLPIADAFDAEVEAVEALTNCRRLANERLAASGDVRKLQADINGMVAGTIDGLAVHARVLAKSEWYRENTAYTPLLLSVAAVTGTELSRPDFDVPAWIATWEGCGGRIERIERKHHQDEWSFIFPSLAGASADTKNEVIRVARMRSENSAIIGRWLDANR